MQVGELSLEFDQRRIGPGDIARPAGTRSHPGGGLDHGANHLRMLAHAQIVVRAPDHHVLWALRRLPDREGAPSGDALQLGEHAVASSSCNRESASAKNLSWVMARNLRASKNCCDDSLD